MPNEMILTNFFIGKTNFETTIKIIENKLLEEIMSDIKKWKEGHNGERNSN